jgi:chromosome partitioning protein
VYARRPNDCDLLIPAIDIHRAKLARAPRLLAADAALLKSEIDEFIPVAANIPTGFRISDIEDANVLIQNSLWLSLAYR